MARNSTGQSQRIDRTIKMNPVKLRIHPFFLAMLVLAGFMGHGRVMFASFISVLFHEMAHAVVAWAFSYRTYRIDLYPFGGVAQMDSALAADGTAEGLTALAGPFHSLIIAFLAHYGGIYLGGGDFWNELARINFSLGIINLLPFYPLDGGRIFRALLAPFLPLKRATDIAVKVTRYSAGIAILPAVYLVIKMRLPWISLVLLAMLFLVARNPQDYLYLRWRQAQKRREQLAGGSVLPVNIRIANGKNRLGQVGSELDGRRYQILLATDEGGGVAGWIDETRIWEALMSGEFNSDLTTAVYKNPADKRGVPNVTVERKKAR
jgi:stage IV sporulation protein FB